MTSATLSLPATLTGKVIHGDKQGRTIGFPTANLDIVLTEAQLKPGVYIGTCEVEGKIYRCLPYFGPRHVVGQKQNVFEVFIYDFDQEIYGKEVSVQLVKFLRAPLNIKSFDELKAQLEKDKLEGRKG